MQRIYSADDLLQGTVSVTSPVFLDTTSWSYFEDWARQNLKALKATIKRGLVIWIFTDELKHTEPEFYHLYVEDQQSVEDNDDITDKEPSAAEEPQPGIPFEKQWENNLGIKFHRERLPSEDIPYQTFLYEVKDIYFYDLTNRERCDRHAEFVYLTRRAARNEDTLRVLSAQPAFQRLVNAEVYLIPGINYDYSLPANFDVFTELRVHPRIRKVVELDFRNRDYSKVVFQAVNAFRDYVREINGFSDDGGQLMNKALCVNYDASGLVASLPPLLLSDFMVGDSSHKSEVGEQEGFYRFAQGVFKAIRNPNAHNTWTDPFIQSRYHGENKAIKVLCFLSFLCERLDNRFSPQNFEVNSGSIKSP